jgi:formiminotetrahydrofolate cyclodeaminase
VSDSSSASGSRSDLSSAFQGVIERFSSPDPLPAGGSATALVACLAAALVVKVAVRRGDADTVERARQLAVRAAELADEDIVAYAEVLDTVDVPRDDPARAGRLEAALAAAAEPPLEVTEIAAEVAVLAAQVGADAHAALRASGVTIALTPSSTNKLCEEQRKE